MSIRITYRAPIIGVHPPEPGSLQQRKFPELQAASSWIVMHIAEPDRVKVRLWIDDIEITGHSRIAALRALSPGQSEDIKTT